MWIRNRPHPPERHRKRESQIVEASRRRYWAMRMLGAVTISAVALCLTHNVTFLDKICVIFFFFFLIVDDFYEIACLL